MHARRGLGFAVLLLLATTACRSADGWVENADVEVESVLAETTFRVLETREGQLEHPLAAEVLEVAPPEDNVAPAPGVTPEDARMAGIHDGWDPDVGPDVQPMEIDLETALAAAFTTSREYATRRETLYLQGLSLSLTRFDFGPQLNATVSTVFTDREDGPRNNLTAGTFGLSQILPSGGTFALNSALTHRRRGTPGAFQNYTSLVDLSISQPLLRGAGYEVSHEALTQAERNMVYEVRSFELFRQDHAISIASDYFDLVSERTQLLNEERRYTEAVFDREKAEALRQLDRNEDEDVFLARRNEINSESGVLVARANYDRQVDSFRIRLGLPEDQVIEIADEDPPFTPVSLDPDSAVNVALHNRLDLITAAEQVEDRRRQVRISKDGFLPDLDLGLSYGNSGISNPRTGALNVGDPLDPDDDVVLFTRGGKLFDEWNSSVALTMEVPIQRTPERNAYRSTVIAFDRAQRNYDILLETVDRDIRDALRQIERAGQQIDLQIEQIAQEERAVAVTEIRYEAGDVENRALLEARRSLIDAQNALISFQVSHFVSRLDLYRDLGLLFIESDGMWRL